MERQQSSNFQFPPGFRFHPSDEELIIHYLKNKVASRPLPATIMAEIDLYKYNPWELPKKAFFGEKEWYFFSPRDRKYPNGKRPKRAAGTGYWKAIGTDKPIVSCSGSKNIGVKKALVFYSGRPPKGIKTDWIMNEYRLLDSTIKPSRSKGSMRLDDWVLYRVRQRSSTSKNTYEVRDNQNKDLIRYLPKMEGACRAAYTNYTTDMITDCLNKDCRLLASILAGETLPRIENISRINHQGSNQGNSFTSAYKDGRDKLNSPITVPNFNDYSPIKTKPNEDSIKQLDMDLLPRDTLPSNIMYYYSQHEPQDSFHNPNTFYPISGYLELNEFTFSGK